MAREVINIGTTPNDKTGDPFRTINTKVNDNFEELYQVAGWGYYKDNESSDLTVTTSETLLTINGLDINTNTDYLPLQIRGVSELWGLSKINAINIGDGYDVRFDFGITGKTGSPTYMDLIFDIGGGATPTISIVERNISLSKTPPYKLSVAFPLFSLTTFVNNGGQVFLKTDSGTVTITSRAVLIKRDFKEL